MKEIAQNRHLKNMKLTKKHPSMNTKKTNNLHHIPNINCTKQQQNSNSNSSNIKNNSSNTQKAYKPPSNYPPNKKLSLKAAGDPNTGSNSAQLADNNLKRWNPKMSTNPKAKQLKQCQRSIEIAKQLKETQIRHQKS